jgi:hypothetical protein
MARRLEQPVHHRLCRTHLTVHIGQSRAVDAGYTFAPPARHAPPEQADIAEIGNSAPPSHPTKIVR